MTVQLFAQKETDLGINIKGYRSYWAIEKVRAKQIKKQIDFATLKGIKDIRLPISFNLYLNSKGKLKKRFKKELRKIVKYAQKRKVTLIVCNFNHQLNQNNYQKEGRELAKNWGQLIKCIKKYNNVYYELLNEPNLYPNEWWNIASTTVAKILKVKPDAKILLGATNYNSIYELSRLKPLPQKNITYVFHFYEPFIFTHQGAPWINKQNTTVQIPYPYHVDKMPMLNPRAIGTEGEVNYRDYNKTGNKQALQDKVGIVNAWATKHQVTIWCTEFGVINKADITSQKNYLNDLVSVFRSYNIKHFLWIDDAFFVDEQLRLMGL